MLYGVERGLRSRLITSVILSSCGVLQLCTGVITLSRSESFRPLDLYVVYPVKVDRGIIWPPLLTLFNVP